MTILNKEDKRKSIRLSLIAEESLTLHLANNNSGSASRFMAVIRIRGISFRESNASLYAEFGRLEACHSHSATVMVRFRRRALPSGITSSLEMSRSWLQVDGRQSSFMVWTWRRQIGVDVRYRRDIRLHIPTPFLTLWMFMPSIAIASGSERTKNDS